MSTGSNQEIYHHAFDVLTSLQDLRTSNVVCDFTVKVGDDSFTAHRNVLAACSPYFRSMFSSNMTEANEGLVDMKGVEANAVKLAIDFMYTGKVELNRKNVPKVLHAADFMQMERLKDICFKFLVEKMTAENCFQVKRLAQTYNEAEWKEECEKYIEKNFSDVYKTDDFLHLGIDDIEQYVEKMAQKCDIAWRATVAWVIEKLEDREQYLHQLLQLYHKKFDFKYIFETALQNPLVQRSEKCKQLLLSDLFSPRMQLSYRITTANCSGLNKLSHNYDSADGSQARSTLLNFMVTNFQKLVQGLGWRKQNGLTELSKEDFTWILARLTDHELICKAILVYLSPGYRKEFDIIDILRAVSPEKWPFDFLLHTIWTSRHVISSEACQEYVAGLILSKTEVLSKINLETCFILKQIAEYNYRESRLVKYAVETFMTGNIDKVIKQNGFLSLTKYEVRKLFEDSPHTHVEKEKLRALFEWVRHDNDRVEDLPDLLRTFNFSELLLSDIEHVRKGPLMTPSMGILMDQMLVQCGQNECSKDKTSKT